MKGQKVSDNNKIAFPFSVLLCNTISICTVAKSVQPEALPN